MKKFSCLNTGGWLLAVVALSGSSVHAEPSNVAGCVSTGGAPADAKAIETLQTQIATSTGSCPLIHETKCQAECMDDGFGGKLSPLWAQEYIGADLARSEVLASKSFIPQNAIVWDQFSEEPDSGASHGSLVAGLVAGEGPQAVSPKTGLIKVDIDDSKLKTKQSFVDASHAPDASLPRVLNLSGVEAEKGALKVLEKEGVIPVVASGNDFPFPTLSFEASDPKLILVGSLSPHGLVSGFSGDSRSVTVTAPSDIFIQSSHEGTPTGFSGTSGAAPLVTGALANVLGFLPDLPVDLAKELLIRTAIPTLNSYQIPRLNGAGTVNAYKLVMVAKKVGQACSSTLSSSEKLKCERSMILQSSTYDFLPTPGLANQVAASFPDCATAGTSPTPGVSCSAQEDTLRSLRKEALLRTDDTSLWSSLACIYRQQGFGVNAFYYDTLAKLDRSRSPATLLPDLKSLFADKAPVSIEVYNNLGSPGIDPEKYPIPSGNQTIAEGTTRFTALRSLMDLGPAGKAVVKSMLSDPNPISRIIAMDLLVRKSSSEGLAAVTKGVNDPDAAVRSAALDDAYFIGAPALPAIARFASDPHEEIREGLAQTISSFGPKSLPILAKIASDKEYPARLQALKGLAKLGDASLPVVADLLKSNNKDVRREAAELDACIRAKKKCPDYF